MGKTILRGGAVAFALGTLITFGALSGCARPSSRITVPAEILRGANGEGGVARGRYVVRMTNGDQDWEMQLPEIATAYEVRIPLRGEQVGAVEQSPLTAADKEILAERETEARERGDESTTADDDGDEREESGRNAGGKSHAPKGGAKKAESDGKNAARKSESPRASYLLTLAKVKELYRTRHYEVALVELVALERQYPDDERILSMKGSLYEKLGKREMARASWQAVLALNPYNLQVAEALQRLDK